MIRTAPPHPEVAARFTAYDTSHLVVLAIFVAGIVALLLWGRRSRTVDPHDRLGRGLAVAMLALTVPLQALYFTAQYWDFTKTLPIQLCDLASFVAVYALWTHRPWAVGLVYYWGLTLTTQAILTPDLSSAFPDPIFLLFWGVHLAIVWAAVHLVWGRRIVPTWRSYAVTVAVTLTWAVTVYAFNVAAGTNYGYLNAKPRAASALDLLGDWPTYLVAEVAIVLAVWALITWPWTGPWSGPWTGPHTRHRGGRDQRVRPASAPAPPAQRSRRARPAG